MKLILIALTAATTAGVLAIADFWHDRPPGPLGFALAVPLVLAYAAGRAACAREHPRGAS